MSNQDREPNEPLFLELDEERGLPLTINLTEEDKKHVENYRRKIEKGGHIPTPSEVFQHSVALIPFVPTNYGSRIMMASTDKKD